MLLKQGGLVGHVLKNAEYDRKKVGIACVVAAFAVMGGALIFHSSAATYRTSAEAEAGTMAGASSKVSDASASGSSAVKFGTGGSTTGTVNLDDPVKKEIAMQLVSSAENSSLDWKAQYSYIEDIGDGRGYTGGIIGFCSGCGDMYELVNYYNQQEPSNVLSKYTATLKSLGDAQSASHTGLDPNFTKDWATAAKDPVFQAAQNEERDRVYFNPAVQQGKADGLHALGQFIYYDAMVVHGPGDDTVNCSNLKIGDFSFGGIRAATLCSAKPPSQGGDEKAYLNAYLKVRTQVMQTEAAHSDVTRISTEQQVFLNNGNLNLDVPLSWSTYGDPYKITVNPTP